MFELDKKSGSVKGVAVARGNTDDAKPLLTIKLQVKDVRAPACAYLTGADDQAAYVTAMFRPAEIDAEENRVLTNAGGIACDFLIEDAHRIKISSLPWVNTSTVRSVTVFPRAKGLSDIEFTATVADPPANYFESLARLLHVGTSISMEQDAGVNPKRSSDPAQTEMSLPNDGGDADADKNLGRADAMAAAIRKSKGKPRGKPKRKRAA